MFYSETIWAQSLMYFSLLKSSFQQCSMPLLKNCRFNSIHFWFPIDGVLIEVPIKTDNSHFWVFNIILLSQQIWTPMGVCHPMKKLCFCPPLLTIKPLIFVSSSFPPLEWVFLSPSSHLYSSPPPLMGPTPLHPDSSVNALPLSKPNVPKALLVPFLEVFLQMQ